MYIKIMSTENESSLKIVRILDPELDVPRPDQREYSVLKGGSEIQYFYTQAQTASLSQISYAGVRPPDGVIVSRRFRHKVVFRMTFGGARPQNQELRSESFGYRSYPLARMCDTQILRLNTESITATPGIAHQYLQRYGSSPEDRNNWLSGSPSYPEYVSGYGLTNVVNGQRNPFSTFEANTSEMTRNFWNYLTAVNSTDATDTGLVNSLEFTFYEPVFISPLVWGSKPAPGFVGLTSVDLTCNMNASNVIKRILCGNIAGATGLLASFTDGATVPSIVSAQLVLKYVNPAYNQVFAPLYIYPYFSVDVKQDSANTALTLPQYTGLAVAGANSIISTPTTPSNVDNITEYISNTYILSSVPKRMFFFAKYRQSAYENRADCYRFADVCARIRGISVRWNAKSSLLSTYPEEDLHKISVESGLDQSWVEWSRVNGSVLCIDPNLHLGLLPLEASGVSETINFQFTLRLSPMGAVAGSGNVQLPYEVVFVAVNEGIFTIKRDYSAVSTGILLPSDLHPESGKVVDAPSGSYNEVIYGGARGAGFWGDVWKKVKKYMPYVLKGVKTASQVAQSIAPALQSAFPQTSAVPIGAIAQGIEKGLSAVGVGSQRRMIRPRRGRGGAIMSCDRLASRME